MVFAMVKLVNVFAMTVTNILAMDANIPNAPTTVPLTALAIHRQAFAIAKLVPIVNLTLLVPIVPFVPAKTIAMAMENATTAFVNATKVLQVRPAM